MADSVDHTSLLVDPFYELKEAPNKKTKFPSVTAGQLVWAHLVYPAVPPWIAEVTGFEPGAQVTYKIRKLDLDQPAPTHFPIKEMKLRADENLYLLHGKLRPGVVVQTIDTDFYNVANPEPYCSVIPCYTFKEKHTLEYRVRVAAFTSRNLFFMPKAHEGLLEESVLRFEHIQPVPLISVRPILKDRKASFLTDAAWALFQHWYHYFLTGRTLDIELHQTIDAYREIVLNEYGFS